MSSGFSLAESGGSFTILYPRFLFTTLSSLLSFLSQITPTT
jgi:hypothetical protein